MNGLLFGGVELGGTKCLAAVGRGADDLRAITRVTTTTPTETLAALGAFFRDAQAEHGAIAALGIGSFGPVDLDRTSPAYGHVTTTPKAGWRDADVVGAFRMLGVPIGFDTDVNAAALGEWRDGAGRGLGSLLYLTVGTGIGGGAVLDGQPLHGLLHPEMGHVRVPHDRDVDPFSGLCPFHDDCLEGLASGPAMAARWGQPAETLPADHPAWRLEAHYLALALQGFVCTLSPHRIVIGGGVASQPGLLAKVREDLRTLLNGYVQSPEILGDLASYVTSPTLSGQAGLVGALVLAERAARAGR